MKSATAITALIAAASTPVQAYIASAYTGTHCNGEQLGKFENHNDRCIDLDAFVDGYQNTASFYIQLQGVDSPQDHFQFLSGGCVNNKVLYRHQGGGCVPAYSKGAPDIMWKRSA